MAKQVSNCFATFITPPRRSAKCPCRRRSSFVQCTSEGKGWCAWIVRGSSYHVPVAELTAAGTLLFSTFFSTLWRFFTELFTLLFTLLSTPVSTPVFTIVFSTFGSVTGRFRMTRESSASSSIHSGAGMPEANQQGLLERVHGLDRTVHLPVVQVFSKNGVAPVCLSGSNH